MKKSLVALAALAVVGAASAQSSVTLYGIVDATLAYGSGDISNRTQLANSGYNSSRLGFKGVEDLGGGLKASFVLEGALSNDDGTAAGYKFARKSVVSLLGGFGELRLGRDYTPQFWNQTVYDPFGTNGVGTQRAFLGSNVTGLPGGATAVRASNSIGYLSPSMSGFGIWAQLYMGENASTAPAQVNDGGALRVSYGQGPLSVALGYGKTITGPGTDIQSTNLGASYNLGMATLMGLVTKDQWTGFDDINGFVIGGLVPMGPGTIRVSFSGTKASDVKTDQFAIGYVYDLSKRTSVYGTFATVNNGGGAASALNGSSTKADGSSNGFDLGIKHSF